MRQNGRKSIWVFAAVEPATGWSLAMPFRDVNTATMQAFLDAAASKLRRREHAVMILDAAGWHSAHKLRWPRRIAPLFLPPYSPELNPAERLWHWLREHHWSNRTYAAEHALVEEAIRSHRALRGSPRASLQPADPGWLWKGTHHAKFALASNLIRTTASQRRSGSRDESCLNKKRS